VEFSYPRGSAPNSHAVDVLKQTIQDVTNKDPVRFVMNEGLDNFPARGQNGKYTIEEIRQIERANREHYSSGSVAALHVLYVDGGSDRDEGNARVLGAVYGGSSIVMYKGNIQAATRSDGGLIPTFQATERCVERAVLVHELGHVLGLVNLGTPMTHDREDTRYPGHSTSEDSVMHHAIRNTASLASVFSGGCSDIPYQFDRHDLADLRAVRER
jgi:hypothetical protein